MPLCVEMCNVAGNLKTCDRCGLRDAPFIHNSPAIDGTGSVDLCPPCWRKLKTATGGDRRLEKKLLMKYYGKNKK